MAEAPGRAKPPSPWVVRFRDRIPRGGTTLDVACGGGRHTRLLLERGHRVTAVDRDLSGVADLAAHPRFEGVQADLEAGDPPLRGRRFDGVVVTNYLHRPLLDDIVDAVDVGGVLLYETFARGNERFGRPTDPRFLLQPGELLEAVWGSLRVIAYEDLVVNRPPVTRTFGLLRGPDRVTPRPAAVQRICAVREQPAGPASGEGKDHERGRPAPT